MAESKKAVRERTKLKYLELITNALRANGEEVLRVGSNVIACPVVNDDGTEDFIEIPIKVPTGSDKGATPYDGYSLQEDYQIKLKLKEETAQKQAKAKAEKILRDEKARKAKAEMKAKRES